MMSGKKEEKRELKKALAVFAIGIAVCAIVLYSAYFMSRFIFKTGIIGGSGFISCEDRQVESLVNDIESGLSARTGTAFVRVGEALFPWYGELESGMETYEVSGRRFLANGLSTDKINDGRKYLEEKGFIVDRNNIASDMESSTFGYLSDRAACLYRTGLELGGEGGGKDSGHFLELVCGSLCDSSFSNILDSYYLKKSLAEKHYRSTEDVSIEIIWKEGRKMKGEYRNIRPSSQSAIFYGVKSGGNWDIVYDRAVRPDCSKLLSYDFGEEEVKICRDEEKTGKR